MSGIVLIAIPKEDSDASRSYNTFDIQKGAYPPTEEGKYYIPRKFSKLVLAFEKYGLLVKSFFLDNASTKTNEFIFEVTDKCDEETLYELELFSTRFCKTVQFSKVPDQNIYRLQYIFNILDNHDGRKDSAMLHQFDSFYIYDMIREDMKKMLNRMYYIEAHKELDKKKNKKKKK